MPTALIADDSFIGNGESQLLGFHPMERAGDAAPAPCSQE